MRITELFSQRRKRQQKEADQPDAALVKYDVPQEMRVNIVQILTDALGPPGRLTHLTGDIEETHTEHWNAIAHIVARNRGQMSIASGRGSYEQVTNAVLYGEDALVLDIVEVAFSRLEDSKRYWEGMRGGHADRVHTSEAIRELNGRFAQWKVGYRFEKDQLLRIDSEFMHEEVTKPALRLLNQKGFAGPENEFLNAHEHFRKGEHRQAVTFSLASFESTMKAILDQRGWLYPVAANAKNLLDICFEKGLIPEYLISHFSSLRNTLESGLPSLRNREGPHGGGAEIKTVPSHVAAYALHLAATNIIFLVECNSDLHK
ncbi:hypothetical protein A3D11_00845 [Candidatus Peribacteria bacterium RIFCSPHIGHO2_02_FULL_49_16]|nr:MAG: hypothetical protein A2880_01290 [Candidatus Peribacteria bacterium RIFCSPHIGHO2_01_FULL_49_38]OGJ60074.1 MAG: hypothetical protein A3D11_00845 [Candidatus Peribacteria bacterium RIFCSPHIGHO2_02_FULL_49_16]